MRTSVEFWEAVGRAREALIDQQFAEEVLRLSEEAVRRMLLDFPTRQERGIPFRRWHRGGVTA